MDNYEKRHKITMIDYYNDELESTKKRLVDLTFLLGIDAIILASSVIFNLATTTKIASSISSLIVLSCMAISIVEKVSLKKEINDLQFDIDYSEENLEEERGKKR